MGLAYENLDTDTRRLMVEEIDGDIAGRGLYQSSYLTEAGLQNWAHFLRDAAKSGSDASLEAQLTVSRSFRHQVERRKPKGGFTMVSVPYTAAQTLAEAQFNLYYIRALARRAIDEARQITVYRAKAVDNPRPTSEQMIGTALDPAFVLQSLRDTLGVEPPIGVPLPNTGITVRLE